MAVAVIIHRIVEGTRRRNCVWPSSPAHDPIISWRSTIFNAAMVSFWNISERRKS